MTDQGGYLYVIAYPHDIEEDAMCIVDGDAACYNSPEDAARSIGSEFENFKQYGYSSWIDTKRDICIIRLKV
jgi:hypothetical protein